MNKHTVIITKPDGTTIEFQFSDEDKLLELVQYLIKEKGFDHKSINLGDDLKLDYKKFISHP